jgi:hypothetical protein
MADVSGPGNQIEQVIIIPAGSFAFALYAVLGILLLFNQIQRKMFLDAGKRNVAGFTPASADFARIDNIESMDEISSQASALILDGMPLPFNFYVSPGL